MKCRKAATALPLPSRIFCPRCKRIPSMIVDYEIGYKICSECGLFLEKFNPDHIILDEIPESGTKDDDQGLPSSKTDKPIDSNMVIETPVGKKNSKQIRAMADRLSLGTAIKRRACEIYNEVDVLKTCRGRSMNSILAACLFIACREIRHSRTLEEISAVANGVSKKNINKAIEAIKNEHEFQTRTVQPEELVTRFCSRLGLQEKATQAVYEAVKRTEEVDIRRSPNSILATIIYIITQLSNDKISVNEIAMAAEVREVTIRKCYKDISHHVLRIIPDWYAKEEEIQKVPMP